MRYLAIDLGDRRTGLAVGDDETKLATPLAVLELPREPGDQLVAQIAQRAASEGVGALVIGLPLNMDGTMSPRATLTRAFGERLAEACELRVHEHDERLTSARADQQMAQTGLTHKQKKQRRDALAAAAILQGFLEQHTAEHAVQPPVSWSVKHSG